MKHFKMLILYCLLLSYFCLNSDLLAQNFWTQVGEGGGIYGSSVNAMAVDSTGTLYAATWGGLFRSTDDSKIWVSLGYEDQVIWDIVIMEGDEIYATSSSAVYYSINKGDSWINRDIQYSKGANSFTISTDGRLFAGTVNGPYLLNPNTKAWVAQSEPGAIIREHGTRYIAVDSAGTIYSATGLDQEDGGLYRSPDSGNNWIDITPPSGTRVVKVVEVDNNGRLWAGTGKGVFFSDDKGDSWEYVNILPASKYFNIDFAQDGAIYVSCKGCFFVSRDGGQSWDMIFDKSVSDVVFLPDKSLFAATRKGVYYFDEKNELWIERNFGMTSAFIFDIAFDKNETLYMASNVGLYSSKNDGYSFNLELNDYGGKDIDARSIEITENGEMFVGSGFNGIYYKAAGSNSWQNAIAPRIISDIVKHPSGVLFAGSWGGRVSFSEDNGKSWQSTTLPDNLSVAKLLVAADGGLFVGATKADEDPWFIGYYYSPDVGKTWTRTVFKEYYGTGQQIWAMIKHPNNDLYIGTVFGIFRSKDNGVNWDHIYEEYLQTSYGTSLVSIEDFAVSEDEKIFAGTNHGIILSQDEGNTWTFLESTGLVNKRISCVEISPSGYLFIGTIGAGGSVGGGTFRSMEKVANFTDTTGVKTPILQFTLNQNYPNPFNPETEIQFQIPENMSVLINIYNVLGQKIRTLANKKYNAGYHSVF